MFFQKIKGLSKKNLFFFKIYSFFQRIMIEYRKNGKEEHDVTYPELCRRLAEAGIENADYDAACLLERFCHAERGSVRADPRLEYGGRALKDAVERRLRREPLQYILGEWAFYRQTYEVSPHCLIPRSDTERLVEEAIRRLPLQARFADLCTGSGCIAVSVLAERPDTSAVAVDLFAETLSVAVRNAERNGVRDRLTPLCADVLTDAFLPHGQRFDAVFCNPPYILSDEVSLLAPELMFEPHAALDGGEDGLLFYRHLIPRVSEWLTPNAFLLFEIGSTQAEAVCDLGRQNGFDRLEVIRDYGGNDRVVFLSRT